MKKTFEVTITKQIEIDVPDEVLSDEYLASFSKFFFDCTDLEEYWKYIAQYVARLDSSFVEGVGEVKYKELNGDVEVQEIARPAHC